jgi:hypothetical protein
VISTLPLHPRNRLAELILAALRDDEARRTLHALASGEREPDAWLGESSPRPAGGDGLAARVRERARRAGEAMQGLHLPADAGLEEVLAAAGALFDAGLGFEVHELLEPHWAAASGETREALQGLIQVAVGYQHLANGNLAGARALLAEGAARLEHGRLPAHALRTFAAAVRATIPSLPPPVVPAFPRPQGFRR